YDLTNANVIVSLDADFLASGVASLRYARQFAAKRRPDGEHPTMNRLYVVEPMPTPTGTKADHRIPMRASEIEDFAWGLASRAKEGLLGAIARDLERNRGASLVIAGDHQPPIVHELAHRMNASPGNVGKTAF